MKKTISLILSAVLCLSFCAALFGCKRGNGNGAHVHEYQTVWTYDKESHWHACEGGGCTDVADKSAHTWDDGVVEDNLIVYRCTACGYAQITDDLDGVVTESEWKTILGGSFFSNVTFSALTESNFYPEGYKRVLRECRVTEDGVYEGTFHYDESVTLLKTETRYVYEEDGKVLVAMGLDEESLKNAEEIGDTTMRDYAASYGATLPSYLLELTGLYSQFVYDAYEGCYVAEALSATVLLDGGEEYVVDYDLFKVWIENGQLSRIVAEGDEVTATLTYTDYGATAFG